MSNIQFQLVTDKFLPGERIQGILSWSFDNQPADIHLRIIWKTSVRGTDDIEIVDSFLIECKNSMTGEEAIDRQLPDFPHSFSGKLISLEWFIEASIDCEDVAERKHIVIAPNKFEIRL